MPKKKFITVTLPEPCAEDWEQMQPNGCGKFCASCQKTVIDFSLMPNENMARILSNNPTGLCGHFSEAQLNKPFEIVPLGKNKSYFRIGKRIAAALLLVPTLAPNLLFAQKQNKKTMVARYPIDSVTAQTICLQGTVKDALTEEPLTGMLITALGIGTQISDKNGNFNFTIPKDSVGKSITVSAVYQPGSSPQIDNAIILEETILIDSNSKQQFVTLLRLPLQVLKFDNAGSRENFIKIEDSKPRVQYTITHGGAPVTYVNDGIAKRPSLWKRTKNLFKKKENHN